jgi:hypothetical protein
MEMADSEGPDIPKLAYSLLYGKCPACGRRFWNGIWQNLGYTMHYASAHLGIPVFRRLGS